GGGGGAGGVAGEVGEVCMPRSVGWAGGVDVARPVGRGSADRLIPRGRRPSYSRIGDDHLDPVDPAAPPGRTPAGAGRHRRGGGGGGGGGGCAARGGGGGGGGGDDAGPVGRGSADRLVPRGRRPSYSRIGDDHLDPVDPAAPPGRTPAGAGRHRRGRGAGDRS